MSDESLPESIRSKNVHLVIKPQVIECSYTHQFGLEKGWKIDLQDAEYFTITKEKSEKRFNKADIKEFVFEVDPYGNREGYIQYGNAYVIPVQQEEPEELFSLPVYEDPALLSKTESYRLTDMIIRRLAERYDKPYAFKHSVYTKGKEKKLWFVMGFVLLLFLIIIAFIILR